MTQSFNAPIFGNVTIFRNVTIFSQGPIAKELRIAYFLPLFTELKLFAVISLENSLPHSLLVRWRLKLQKFDCKNICKKGMKNINAVEEWKFFPMTHIQ